MLCSFSPVPRHYRQRSTWLRRFTVRILWVQPKSWSDGLPWWRIGMSSYVSRWTDCHRCKKECGTSDPTQDRSFFRILWNTTNPPKKCSLSICKYIKGRIRLSFPFYWTYNLLCFVFVVMFFHWPTRSTNFSGGASNFHHRFVGRASGRGSATVFCCYNSRWEQNSWERN